MKRSSSYLAKAVFVTAFFTLGGCATTARFSPPFTADAQTAGAPQADTPIPYVANCGVLNTGTPSRFVCNGKVYTSFQLARIREEQAKKFAGGN